MTIICEPVLIQAASLRSAETGTHKQTKPNWTTGHKQKWWLKCGARTGFPCSHIFLRHHWYFLVYFILFLLVYHSFCVYGTFGAICIVSGDTSPMYSPSCQIVNLSATIIRISLSSLLSILHSTSLPLISLCINLYNPWE